MGEVSLEELWRMVDGIRVGTEGFALLVAEDGRLLAHGRPDEKARVAAGENLSDHELVAAMTGLSETSASPAPRTVPTLPAGDRTPRLDYEAPDGRMLLGVAAPSRRSVGRSLSSSRRVRRSHWPSSFSWSWYSSSPSH